MEIKKDNIEKPIIPTEVEPNDISHTQSIIKDTLFSEELPIINESSNDKIPTPMNGVYNIMIRVVVFFVVYILLFTVLYYTELQVFTPIIVLISFFTSKPLTKIFSKGFKN
jgi:cytochrome bd-type quinol oxidase subunit 1